MENKLLTIKEASEWATEHLGRIITISNISYLIQYGRIKKFGNNGSTQILKNELIEYYRLNEIQKSSWKKQLGNNLNWTLSFEKYKESETTKHVHRLHPYKGKFIPQLVEYFLDNHIDNFKKEIYFKEGDIILDPFCGSGTTLVQANELNIHAIGIDISEFNSMIANSKITKYNLIELQTEIQKITRTLKAFLENSNIIKFEEKLLEELFNFNNKYFPNPEYRYKIRNKEINEKDYGESKAKEFLPIYKDLIAKYKIDLNIDNKSNFLNKWYFQHIRNEIQLIYKKIQEIENINIKEIITIILSRTIRSCRATTHADLATLIEPVTTTYYCSKHGKICKPLFSVLKWWESYTKDTIKRLIEFNKLRTNTFQNCLTGDSREINILEELKRQNLEFFNFIKNKKIKGIFSSPPYVGLIDYHEQHAYAYDLFNFKRRDNFEIGPLFKGQGKEAKQNYIEGIVKVLKNCEKFLIEDYDIFLVANDKYNMYPSIAENSGMKIINQFERPVLNRTEKDKRAYSETIFHLKRK